MHPLLLLLLLLLPLLVSSLPIDPQPSLILPISPPATIPAFPEQSAAASSSCPINLSPDLLRGISLSCNASSSRSRCCPSLTAWLLSAYARTALSASRSLPGGDLPLLPDDSESCVAATEDALRARGALLPRVNASCGLAYCFCGVRLRRLSCPGPFLPAGGGGEWVPRPEIGMQMERECRRVGLGGCSRCLAALNQLKSGNHTGTGMKQKHKPDDTECQLMGLTWLLFKNRSLYLPTATAVLRALPAATASGTSSCNLPSDDLPLAVDSDQIDGNGNGVAATAALPKFPFSIMLALVAVVVLTMMLP